MLKLRPQAPEPGFKPGALHHAAHLSAWPHPGASNAHEVWEHGRTGWIWGGFWCRKSKAQHGKHCSTYLMLLTSTSTLRFLAQIFPWDSGSLRPTTCSAWFKRTSSCLQTNPQNTPGSDSSLTLLVSVKSIALHEAGRAWSLGIALTFPFPSSLAITLQSSSNAFCSYLSNLSQAIWFALPWPPSAPNPCYPNLPGTMATIRPMYSSYYASVRNAQWILKSLTFAVKSFLSSTACLLVLSSTTLPRPHTPALRLSFSSSVSLGSFGFSLHAHPTLVCLPRMLPSTWLRRVTWSLEALVVSTVKRELKCHSLVLWKIWNI